MTQITQLGLGGWPSPFIVIGDKAPAGYPAIGVLVEEFDIWQEGYDGAVVSVLRAGTTTLVPLYYDPELTDPADNPQTLTTRVDGSGRRYGKFAAPVYSPYAYYLDIDNAQQTGIRFRALYSLAGEDASQAVVTTEGGSRARSLASRFADTIHALDYGEIGVSPETNTTTINNAIAAATAQGGGVVILPAGTIPFNTFNLPANVFLKGSGKGVTVLQSQTAANAITGTGSMIGLIDLTLDGVSVISSSVGLYGLNLDRVQLTNVEIKRFDVNCYWKGGSNHTYRNVDMTGANVNFRARGDLDSAGGGNGGSFHCLDWIGGKVAESLGTGMELWVHETSGVKRNSIRNVRFIDNVGTRGAIDVYGASRTFFENCLWSGNVYNLTVDDNPDTSIATADRKVSGLHLNGGMMTSGTVRLNGLCDDVIFDDLLLTGVTFSLSTPINSIILRNCTETGTIVSGDSTKFLRDEARASGVARVDTTDDTTTTIYRQYLAPNKIALFEVLLTAEQTNGADYAVWHVTHAARGAVATLAYDNQTANFTAGKHILGQTSGATAVIVADSDSGTTGTLSLGDVVGTFLDNEVIAESDGTGSAQANGILVEGSAAAIGTATEVHAAGSNAGAPPAAWGGLSFAFSGQEVLLRVNGAASTNLHWDAKINIVYRN